MHERGDRLDPVEGKQLPQAWHGAVCLVALGEEGVTERVSGDGGRGAMLAGEARLHDGAVERLALGDPAIAAAVQQGVGLWRRGAGVPAVHGPHGDPAGDRPLRPEQTLRNVGIPSENDRRGPRQVNAEG